MTEVNKCLFYDLREIYHSTISLQRRHVPHNAHSYRPLARVSFCVRASTARTVRSLLSRACR